MECVLQDVLEIDLSIQFFYQGQFLRNIKEPPAYIFLMMTYRVTYRVTVTLNEAYADQCC